MTTQANNTVQSIFITGCYRSGTTLADKLVHALPQTCVGSQPFTEFYLDLKALFLRERYIDTDLPLGDLFGENRYCWQDFRDYLSDIGTGRLSAATWTALAWAVDESVDSLRVDQPIEHLRLRLARLLAKRLGRGDARIVGEKEIVCEEFIPFLLARNVRVLLVVRHPADVVRSAHFGGASRHLGRNRPVLYTVRCWRKSVSYALRFGAHPALKLVRFEDMVSAPQRIELNLRAWLGLPTDTLAVQGLDSLRDQLGRRWRPNSSWTNQGDFKLPHDVARFVAAACGPELRAMGYGDFGIEDLVSAIEAFREPKPVDHPLFRQRYKDYEGELKREVRRLEAIARVNSEPTLSVLTGDFARLKGLVR